MLIGACAQINVHENVFVCVSAFVMKMSSNLFGDWGCDWAICLVDLAKVVFCFTTIVGWC